MRLIDADALGVGRCNKDVLPSDYCTSWNRLIDIINEAPTVDAVPVKHGHWIIPNDDILVSCICSVCGWHGYYYEDDVSNETYCPHCGAILDEPRDDKQN